MEELYLALRMDIYHTNMNIRSRASAFTFAFRPFALYIVWLQCSLFTHDTSITITITITMGSTILLWYPAQLIGPITIFLHFLQIIYFFDEITNYFFKICALIQKHNKIRLVCYTNHKKTKKKDKIRLVCYTNQMMMWLTLGH